MPMAPTTWLSTTTGICTGASSRSASGSSSTRPSRRRTAAASRTARAPSSARSTRRAPMERITSSGSWRTSGSRASRSGFRRTSGTTSRRRPQGRTRPPRCFGSGTHAPRRRPRNAPRRLPTSSPWPNARSNRSPRARGPDRDAPGFRPRGRRPTLGPASAAASWRISTKSARYAIRIRRARGQGGGPLPHLEPAAERALEEVALAPGGPDRDARVAVRDEVEPDETVVERDVRLADELVAAALEVLGDAQERGHPVEAVLVALLGDRIERPERRHALAVVADRLADQRDLALTEPRQAGVQHEVAGVLVVVVVVDRHADVVQQRGGPQQLALVAVAGMDPGGGERVEQAERQMRDVGDVRVVLGAHAVLRGEVDDRRAADVVEQRLAAAGAREVALEEDALAQTRLGDVDRVEAALVEDRLHHERAAEDDVGAAGLDAGHLAALGRRQLGELVDERVERLAGEHEPLDAELGDLRLALGGGGEVAHRAADPDDPRARPRDPRRALEGARDERAQLAQLLGLGGLVVGEEALGHPHGAERPRVHLAGEPALDADELHRAAADVEHHAVGERRRVHGGEI